MEENTESLNKLNEGSCVFGEWIGTGQIGYGENLDKRFYIFAKANVKDDFEVSKINYDYNLFKYPFEGARGSRLYWRSSLSRRVKFVTLSAILG